MYIYIYHQGELRRKTRVSYPNTLYVPGGTIMIKTTIKVDVSNEWSTAVSSETVSRMESVQKKANDLFAEIMAGNSHDLDRLAALLKDYRAAWNKVAAN